MQPAQITRSVKSRFQRVIRELLICWLACSLLCFWLLSASAPDFIWLDFVFLGALASIPVYLLYRLLVFAAFPSWRRSPGRLPLR